MATIAILTVKDDGFEGTLTTLNVTAQIAILPNAKSKDSEPDYRVVSRKNGFNSAQAGSGSRSHPAQNMCRSRFRPLSSGRSTATSPMRRATIPKRRSSSGTRQPDRLWPRRTAGPFFCRTIERHLSCRSPPLANSASTSHVP